MVLNTVEWSTENNVSTIQLADATEVLAFYMAFYQTHRGHIESGLALKAQVRAATSIADVLDIEDDR